MGIPADIETYQVTAVAATLYYAKNSGRGGEREDSMIAVRGGTIDIYGALHKPGTPPTAMILDRAAFAGFDVFAAVPTYLYFVVDTGSPIITLSSIEITEVP